MGREIATHVGPRYEVVGALIERRDHRVLDNGVGQLQIKRIFDEVKHGLASGRVSPHVDIGLEVGYDSVRAEERLSLNGLKEHLHVRLEPLLNRRGTVANTARPKAERKGVRVRVSMMRSRGLGGMHCGRQHLLSRELGRVVLLDPTSLTAERAVGVWPLERVHDPVREALSVQSQITVGDVVQVEEIVHKVAHDAEAARRAVIVAVRGKFARLQAAHGGDLAFCKVRRI